jgi:hypothetical protein
MTRKLLFEMFAAWCEEGTSRGGEGEAKMNLCVYCLHVGLLLWLFLRQMHTAPWLFAAWCKVGANRGDEGNDVETLDLYAFEQLGIV